MSMLDGFFNKGGFKGAKCKTLLKLTIPRIKLLRNRREIQLKQMRRDIAKLLENGQEATARIRVEHIIREENMMAAQEILELFCELIAVRLPIIETQRECPLDLKEAISSVCFAAPRCSDLPELQQVQMLFAAKYGREFIAAATELMPDCGVNRQIVELLSIRAPSVEAKLKLLKKIAEEHELEWDPAASETEFLKPHEDLLNGPNHITGGSSLPLPKEKHGDTVSSKPSEEYHEELDSDAGFDSLDLPEVPKVSVRTTPDTPSAPGLTSPPPHSPPHHIDLDSGTSKSTPSYAEPQLHDQDRSASLDENKQFQYIPFVASPPPVPFPVKQSNPTPSFPHDANPSLPRGPAPSVPLNQASSLPHDSTPSLPCDPTPSSSHPKPQSNADLQDILAAAQAAADTAERAAASTPKPESNADLQDVLAAAQAAADSAERAAAAARAAASLAQVRITELINRKKGSRISHSDEQDNLYETSDRQNVAGNPNFDQQNSFGRAGHFPGYEPAWNINSPLSPENVSKMDDDSPDSRVQAHQPQRSTSLEDDSYFSYPNLFSRRLWN